jgi:addiction module RelE/StbE family toxin
MIVQQLPSFVRSYQKLTEHERKSTDSALALFVRNPFAQELRNHKLKGRYKGFRSISAGFDLRILYREEGNHAIIVLVNVGTHEQVYR